jgi:hypothetical protein
MDVLDKVIDVSGMVAYVYLKIELRHQHANVFLWDSVLHIIPDAGGIVNIMTWELVERLPVWCQLLHLHDHLHLHHAHLLVVEGILQIAQYLIVFRMQQFLVEVIIPIVLAESVTVNGMMDF